MLLVKIAGALVVVALIVAYLVRGGRRPIDSNSRGMTRGGSPVSPPPSPYPPSRGLRLLDGTEPDSPRAVPLPRLDPSSEFVFSETSAQTVDSVSPPHLRHDEKWALDRSMRRAGYPRERRRRRIIWMILLVVLGLGVVAAVLAGLHSGGHHAGLALSYVATVSW